MDPASPPSALPDPSPTILVDGLTLRPLEGDDEPAVRAMQAELEADGFDALLGEADQDFTGVREAFAREARGDVGPRWVPASFLVGVDEAGDVVGRVSIRWELNAFLAHENGHVGYAVRPGFRRRGHATRLLRGALALLHACGVETALVTCGEANAGSAAAILACGGVLRDSVAAWPDGTPKPEATLRFDVPTRPL